MKHAMPTATSFRHKFFCSHGGKILPRPADGQLKYIGGETRCISAPRGIPFQEVMKRLTYLVDGDMVLKYQLVTEDLDTLVSVKSDEDMVFMFDEMDLYGSVGFPRMRAFLFPVNQALLMENQTQPIPGEQLYIYSINGIQLSSLSSSPCSSPRSPDTCTSATPESLLNNNCQSGFIQGSTRTCSNLNKIPHQNHLHPLYYNLRKNAAATPEQRLVSVRSVGRSDGFTTPPTGHYFYGSREINQGCAKGTMHHEDHRGRFFDTRILERQATLPANF